MQLIILLVVIIIFLHFCCLRGFLLCSLQSFLFLHRWVFGLRDLWSAGKLLLWWGWRRWAVVLCTEFLAPSNINVLKFSGIKKQCIFITVISRVN